MQIYRLVHGNGVVGKSFHHFGPKKSILVFEDLIEWMYFGCTFSYERRSPISVMDCCLSLLHSEWSIMVKGRLRIGGSEFEIIDHNELQLSLVSKILPIFWIAIYVQHCQVQERREGKFCWAPMLKAWIDLLIDWIWVSVQLCGELEIFFQLDHQNQRRCSFLFWFEWRWQNIDLWPSKKRDDVQTVKWWN